MTFEQVRDRLIAAGLTFDATSLRELAYVDLVRAGIGDAGPAICSMDLIRAERARRVAEEGAAILQTKGPRLVVDHDLYDAALRSLHSRPTPPPAWDDLSYVTQSYLLLRCLRAHTDDPQERLGRLFDTLTRLQNTTKDNRVASMSLLARRVVGGWMDTLNGCGTVDILTLRKDTFEFFRFFRAHIPANEMAVCSHLEVTGYHCTYGCFIPGVVE